LIDLLETIVEDQSSSIFLVKGPFLTKLLSIIILLMLLTACGAKGDLYLPKHENNTESDKTNSKNDAFTKKSAADILEPKTSQPENSKGKPQS
jgi:predicted small lipoprotein YifL